MKKVLIHTVFLCACSLGFLKTQARDDIYSSAMINWSNPTLMCSVPAPPVNIVSGFSFLGYRTKTLDAYVKCWLNTNNIPPGMGTFSATIDITIKYYLEDPNSNSTQSPVTVNRMLTLDYNAAAGVSYKNVAIENFPNAAKIEIIAVNSFLVNGSAPSAAQKQFISLQLFIKHERYYNYNNIFGGIPMLTLLPNPVPNYDALNNELEISWVPEAFAEGYELQYSFVDDYGNTGWNNNFVPASQLNFSFRNNCTRILLQQTSYKIPLVFEHGWVVWRVRGYSYGGANLDKLFYGPFNATVDGNQIFTVQSYPHKFPVTGNNIVHTNDKISWQSVTSFAEEGKSKTVVKYMDGNWRNRQTVTSASTERNAIVGEDIYDFQGRSAVNILPAPVENAAIKYYKNFNRNLSDLPYTAIDFDTKGPGECDPFAIGPLLQVTGATNNTGAGNYYSKHNPDQSLFNAWIPDADGYALARVTFMPDATNRVVRQGNAGELFQPGKTASGITQSHDTRYYYGKPVQVKLDQLFGTNVGYAQFYQKNLVVDPNGQVSVSYVDLDGKTVATALAGTSPASLEPLGSNPQMPLMVDLLSDADMVDSVSHSIKMSQSILVSANNTPYNFKYKITANTYNALSCQSKNYCLDCIYDLKITLVNDECGRIEYYDSSTVGTLANLDLLCNDPAPNKQVNFTAMLNVGSYTITKELIVNKQAAETYAERIVNDSANTCLKTYNDFYNEAWNNRDTTRCMEACDACIAESANAISTTAVAAAVKACDSLWCKPQATSLCDLARMSMINDLTPGGQYAIYEDAGNNINFQTSLISIFHPDNTLAIKRIYSAPSAVLSSQVILPGEPPRFLSYYTASTALLTQLINNWPDDLSEKLLPLHPEYCYLQFCELNDVQLSNSFDSKYLNATTWAEAQATGLVNGLGNFYSHDPLYNYLVSINATQLVNGFAGRFNDFAGPGISVVQMAVFMADCPSGSNIAACNGTIGDGINDDAEWQRFVGIYYSIKQEFLQKAREYYVQNTGGCCTNGYIGCKDGNCNIPPVWFNIHPNPYPCFNSFYLGLITDIYQHAQKRFVTINDIDFPGMPNPTQSYYDMTPQDLASQVTAAAGQSPCPTCPEMDAFKMMLFDIQNKKWIYNGHTAKADEIAGLKDIFRERFTGSSSNSDITIGLNGNQVSISSKTCSMKFTADTIINWESAVVLPTCLEITDYRHANLQVMVNGSYKTTLRISSTCDLFYCEGKAPDAPPVNNDCKCDSVYDSKATYQPGDIIKYNNICYILIKADRQNGLTPGVLPGGKEFWERFCERANNCVDPFIINFDNNETYTPGLVSGDMPVQPNKYVLRNGFVTSAHHVTTTGNAMFARTQQTDQLIIQKTAAVQPGTNYVFSFDAILLSFKDADCYGLEVKINNQSVFNEKCIQDRQWPWVNTYGWYHFSFPWNSGTGTTITVTISSIKENQTDIIGLDNLQVLCAGTGSTPNNNNSTSGSNTSHDSTRYIPQNVCGCSNLCNAQLPLPELPALSCDSLQKALAAERAREAYADYKDSVFNALLNGYYAHCMNASERFVMDYQDAEYHYTLYYYDQSGNLVQTVPPAGVKPITATAQLNNVISYRNTNTGAQELPPHIMPSVYRHNSLNAVVWQKTPDAGTSEFFYDALGRIALSQNAKQRPLDTASYTTYDKLGRTVEAGAIDVSGVASLKTTAKNYTGWTNFVNNRGRTEITKSWYDMPAKARISTAFGAAGQVNLRNRISTVAVFDNSVDLSTFDTDANPSAIQYSHATHYNYDISGNVTELLQDFGKYTAFGFDPGNVRVQSKHMVYKFDLVSGKVNELQYQPGYPDQFFYRYRYNADNKLTAAFTSSNNFIWENDARYKYYRHGPLARIELGTDSVQGIDMAYTLQGWIKGSNGLAASAQTDIGKDGNAVPVSPPNIGYNVQNRRAAGDVYGYWLSYFKDDYKAISNIAAAVNSVTQLLTSGAYHTAPADLFNGNIRSMYTYLQPVGGMGMQYRYDQLNRIKAETAYDANSSGFSLTANNAYSMALNYDPNGNIQQLLRNGTTALPAMDSLNYIYYNDNGTTYTGNPATINATNRLASVTDAVTAGNYPDDIDNQSAGNYRYDAIGNLVQDTKEGIVHIDWNLQNKITRIDKTGTTIGYFYDAIGNRVIKMVQDNSTHQLTTAEVYVRDAQGNTLAVYRKKNDSIYIKEQQLYGSSRLGVQTQEVYLNGNYFPIGKTPIINILIPGANLPQRPYAIESYRNATQYELPNHLGNVLATVTDSRSNTNTATLATASDYYAFGMAMPARVYSLNNSEYRFGMNGQEKSDEIFKNSFSAEFWEYDSRIGRRWNLDPESSAENSEYACFMSNPIIFSDPLGNKVEFENAKAFFKVIGKAISDKVFRSQILAQHRATRTTTQTTYDSKGNPHTEDVDHKQYFHYRYNKNSRISLQEAANLMDAENIKRDGDGDHSSKNYYSVSFSENTPTDNEKGAATGVGGALLISKGKTIISKNRYTNGIINIKAGSNDDSGNDHIRISSNGKIILDIDLPVTQTIGDEYRSGDIAFKLGKSSKIKIEIYNKSTGRVGAYGLKYEIKESSKEQKTNESSNEQKQVNRTD